MLEMEMAPRRAGGGQVSTKDTLDVQVLHGLDSFLATERFLCKLEQARAEWIDLSDAAHAAAGCAHASGAAPLPPSAAHAHAHAPFEASSSAVVVHEADAQSSAAQPAGHSAWAHLGGAAAGDHAADAELSESERAAAAAAAAAVGDFVVINKNDAVEAMAYYIAMYISRLPEAQRMGPKELQSALKEAFTILRRSKWRLVWSWGRLLYRSAAVSFSALQLYNNPWLLRAVLSALWSSSRLLYAQMV